MDKIRFEGEISQESKKVVLKQNHKIANIVLHIVFVSK